MNLKELYYEIEKHILNDKKPSEFLNTIFDDPRFREYPFSMLYELKNTDQSPEHHPEGNVWIHTLLVLDEAAKLKERSKNKAVFMWAALLHDIGKPKTTKVRRGRITAYDHDMIGAKLSGEFLEFFTDDEVFIGEVSHLIRYHMHILFVVNNLPYGDVTSMIKDTDINEVALLGLCDRLGRTNSNPAREEENIRKFLSMVPIR